MPSLRDYQAQVGLNVSPQVDLSVSEVPGAALEQLGSDLAQRELSIIDRQRKRSAFQAEASYRKLQAQLDQDLFDASQNMAEGGVDFTNGFLTTNYDTRQAEFLAGIEDAELREKYAATLETDRISWGTRAARAEAQELYRFQTSEIADATNTYARGIALDPDSYDHLLEQGYALIESSNLPPARQAEMMGAWEAMAASSYLTERLAQSPIDVVHMLGGDVKAQSPAASAMVYHQAITATADQAGMKGTRISGTGMRVEDAQALLDTVEPGAGLPEGSSEAEWAGYLSDPQVAEAYSMAHLRALQNEFDDAETVFVGYFLGADAAREWEANGSKKSELPAGVRRAVAGVSERATPSGIVGTNVKLIWAREGGTDEITAAELGRTDPNLVSRLQNAVAAAGFDHINITSAERSAEHNAAVGGAPNSQHAIENTGGAGAIDFKWPAGITREGKVRLIKSLSAAGLTGIGIYPSGVHVDLGPRRAWGENYRNDSVPTWARDAIDAHVAGQTPRQPSRSVDPRFANLDEETRLTYLGQAYSALEDEADASLDLAQVRANAQDRVDDYIATIRRTGEPPAGIDVETDLGVMTPSQARTARDDIYVAETVARETKNIAGKSEAELTNMQVMTVRTYEGTGYERDKRIAREIDDAIRETRSERTRHPAAASHEDTAVSEAWEAVQASAADGQVDVPTMENYIRATVRYQRQHFNLSPDQVQYVPTAVSATLADAVRTTLAEPVEGDRAAQNAEYERRAYLLYTQAVQQFGEYADEVLQQVLSTLPSTEVEATVFNRFNVDLGSVNAGSPRRYLTTPPGFADLDTAAAGSFADLSDSAKLDMLSRYRTASYGMTDEQRTQFIDNLDDPALRDFLRAQEQPE